MTDEFPIQATDLVTWFDREQAVEETIVGYNSLTCVHYEEHYVEVYRGGTKIFDHLAIGHGERRTIARTLEDIIDSDCNYLYASPEDTPITIEYNAEEDPLCTIRIERNRLFDGEVVTDEVLRLKTDDELANAYEFLSTLVHTASMPDSSDRRYTEETEPID